MTAGEYCTRDVVITGAQTSVTEAAKLMRQYHVGDLVVTEKRNEDNIPVGIVTDRDLVVEVLAQEVPLDSVSVGDVMSKELVTVSEFDTLVDALEQMKNRGVRRALVVYDHGGLQGILSADDAVEVIAEATSSLASLFRRGRSHEQRERP